MLSKSDYNRDYWCIVQGKGLNRQPIGYDRICDLLGCKKYMIFRKLSENLSQKFVVRPFHGLVMVFYRH